MDITIKRALCALSLVLALLPAAGCQAGPPDPAPPPSAPLSAPSSEPTATPTPEPTPVPAPTPTPEPDYAPYWFGCPLEESSPVEDDSYFDTAVFLGDSRTEGFQLFSGMHHGDFFWARGMSVFRADSEDYQIFEIDGENYTMVGALEQKKYDNVYIMIGINELGYSAERYETGLGALIDKVLEAQPEAVVYLQTLPPVNDEVSRANNRAEYINNENVNAFNEAIVRVASEKKVVLLDTASVYRNEEGILPAEMTVDGAHFTYESYAIWADYLRCHVMEPDRFFYWREHEPPERPEESSPEVTPEPEESVSPMPDTTAETDEEGAA